MLAPRSVLIHIRGSKSKKRWLWRETSPEFMVLKCTNKSQLMEMQFKDRFHSQQAANLAAAPCGSEFGVMKDKQVKGYESSSQLRKSTKLGVQGNIPVWSPERTLWEAVGEKLKLHWRPPECWRCQGLGISAKERRVLQPAKPRESHRVPLASVIELLDLELTLLGFFLALVQYFLMPHFFLLKW